MILQEKLHQVQSDLDGKVAQIGELIHQKRRISNQAEDSAIIITRLEYQLQEYNDMQKKGEKQKTGLLE